MPCTTLLVGKKASYDGSTLMARNEDSPAGEFTAKKFVVVHPEEQAKIYQSVLSHVEIPLPKNPMRYTAMPDALGKIGIWAATGVNEENIAMTATETITSNELVLAADPLVEYKTATDNRPEIIGGIGEEDIVTLTLPYIHSAREGILRLGSLLEKYGTYEMNGIAFQDVDEIWWLETIGGHHWMAIRVPDDQYVVMPNQLGIDHFDFADAYGNAENYLCSKDLKDFVQDNFLDLSLDGTFNPRWTFGSHADADHVYNTPRAWMMLKYFNPNTYQWDGEHADYKPEMDSLPFALKPERKITIEDVKYVLSHHYQGTDFDPYSNHANPLLKGKYRPIGINRNNFLSCTQIRPYMPKENRSIEWVCYGSNVFNAFVPFYTTIEKTPDYLANTTAEVTTENFYWANRIIAALSDAHFAETANTIERYQNTVQTQGHALIRQNDQQFLATKDISLLQQANETIAQMAKKETYLTLDKVLYTASLLMKNGFSRSDA
ncbi:C69 family dipeptidase [Bulleidia sp. zg-1006]|uniref:C69 family dipeptidase n=1 Tax=Bulleidia sp. zg-1006 TaxID=2806552 RepID=UPI00193981B6|nr:C69 family dipeptidase [Bulleidia sp. zg-1006]QRG86233.1 C69 family dipeptidase [Bulleidia sp. zg-1006]